jgi:hypothetical protein
MTATLIDTKRSGYLEMAVLRRLPKGAKGLATTAGPRVISFAGIAQDCKGGPIAHPKWGRSSCKSRLSDEPKP